MSGYNGISLLGLFALLGLAWLVSADRRRLNLRVVGWGMGLQLLFGVFVFVLPVGPPVFEFVNRAVLKVLAAAGAGTSFVFGPLAVPPGEPNSLGFILAVQGLASIVFFSALMSVLYFLRIVPLVVRGFAWVFARLMRVSGAEALCAASNIFVGVESALTVRPYLLKMTRSELCVVLTAGMATVASNILGAYVAALKGVFPQIAGHLVSASVLSAPAALLMAKVILPESGQPETLGTAAAMSAEREATIFEAVINGANAGMKLILGIVALLLAVLGLMALMDGMLGWIGAGVNAACGLELDGSLKGLLGYLFRPLVLLMGVPLDDVKVVGAIVGERSVLTEIPAYFDLAAAMREGRIQHARSVVIATYALCGFAHVASLAIFVGGVSALVPSRAAEVARLGGRALLAATLACLMTGCVAGLFFTGDPTILLGK